MTDAKTVAMNAMQAADRLGFELGTAGHCIVTVTKRIAVDDPAAFADADMSYGDVFALIPSRCGSEWGTDGGSIGGISAMRNGIFRMNKSGVGKRVIAAIRSLAGQTALNR